MTTATPRYRADIDGMRAVAVLAVIAFHLQRLILPGGFLGVDVFFVISGFLITSILSREIGANAFSLWRFYERRLRRIGPALLAVMLATSVAAGLILLPVDLTGFARSLLATLGFVSNVYFWRDTDYFSRAAAEKPLLHTWSLGIEEQFYILFPLVLIVAYRVRRQGAPLAVAALTLASLAAAVFALKIGAGLPAFYLLPTRAWELGAGALLAFAPPTRRLIVNPAAANLVAAAGLVAVGLGLVIDPVVLPALLPPALLPVAGTAALIAAGDATAVARLLALRGPVMIGRMSYSLYLWHWPILVLVRYYVVSDTTPTEDLAMLAAIAAAGFASWRWIEMPFRRHTMSVRRLVIVCAAAALVLAATAAAILAAHGFPSRLNARAARINAAVGTNYRCPIADYLAFGASRGCVLALPSRNPADADVVLLGNSHAQMYAPVTAAILVDHGLHGLIVPANGCLPWSATNIDVPCQATAATNLAAVVRLPARVVIVAFNWNALAGPLVDTAGRTLPPSSMAARVAPLDATIAALRAAGKRVIVVGPTAAPGWDVASILSRALAFGRPVTLPLFTPVNAFDALYGDSIAAFERRRDVSFVRPDRVQCRGARCDYVVAGESLFADDNHLAAAATFRFRGVFEPAIVAAAAR